MDATGAALKLLSQAVTPAGFIASPTPRDNYKRIWARDSVLAGLAALASGQANLIDCFRCSLLTLANYQGTAGQIASNIDATTQQVSYGGSAGRVDATLWFIIGVGQYYTATGDTTTLEQLRPHLVKARQVLQAWEYNNRGLLYVPDTGDWADEYTRGGYVLYDQLLYYRAQQEYAKLMQQSVALDGLWQLITVNYWLQQRTTKKQYVYHQAVYDQAPTTSYWMASFSPFGYSVQFDSWANILASVFGLANVDQARVIDQFIAEHFAEKTHYLLPAFYPVITETDSAWTELNQSYSFAFKNKPHHYHNGGLWPMITGWYVIDLVRRGHSALAKQYLAAIAAANANTFYEYRVGDTYATGGTPQLTWNAALYIIAQRTSAANKVIVLDAIKL
ncbi:MAG: glycogen debranching protein [Candidatus Kerfeldbacteria bacterium]|nr:glycogen debranching protein [Candidatus Kerfeldbacteria bacterium]